MGQVKKSLCWAVAGTHKGVSRTGPSVLNLSPTVQQSNPRSKSKNKPSFNKQQPKNQSSSHPEAKSQGAISPGVKPRPKPHQVRKPRYSQLTGPTKEQDKGRPGVILSPTSKPAAQIPMAHSGAILYAF